MNGLKTVTIGSLGNVVTGSTPSKKDKNNYGDYALWIKPTDINENEKYTRFTEEMFSKKSAEQCKSRIVPKDSICVPCIGTIGTKLTMTPCDCFVNQSINAIVPNEDFDNHYVYYLLRNFLPSLKSHNKGTASGREFIAKTAFEEIEIKVFEDKQIQQKIGLILSEYDNLIDNYRRQIKLLEEAAQRLYKEWFVDLRFPGHEHTKIVDGVPEGWKKNSIDSTIELLSGYAFKSSEFNNKGTYKIVTIKNVKDGQFDGDNVSRIIEIPPKMPKYCRLTDGDILISLTGNVGRVCIVQGENYLLNQRVAKVKSDIPAYTYCLFRSKAMFNEMNNLANGAAQQNLSPIRVGNIQILFPTDIFIQKFEAMVRPIISKINLLNKEINLLAQARDRLLPKLMSGEIKV